MAQAYQLGAPVMYDPAAIAKKRGLEQKPYDVHVTGVRAGSKTYQGDMMTSTPPHQGDLISRLTDTQTIKACWHPHPRIIQQLYSWPELPLEAWRSPAMHSGDNLKPAATPGQGLATTDNPQSCERTTCVWGLA